MSELFHVEYNLIDDCHEHKVQNEIIITEGSLTKMEMYNVLWSVMQGMGIEVNSEEKDVIQEMIKSDFTDYIFPVDEEGVW